MMTKEKFKDSLIVAIIVCCLYMMYHLSESTDTFNTPNTSETQATDALNSVDENESFYIANPNTKKFHRMNCTEIEKMKADHITIAVSKEVLEEQGYRGCKRCNP